MEDDDYKAMLANMQRQQSGSKLPEENDGKSENESEYSSEKFDEENGMNEEDAENQAVARNTNFHTTA